MKLYLMTEDRLKVILAEAWSNGNSNEYQNHYHGCADISTEKDRTIEDILYDLSKDKDVVTSE